MKVSLRGEGRTCQEESHQDQRTKEWEIVWHPRKEEPWVGEGMGAEHMSSLSSPGTLLHASSPYAASTLLTRGMGKVMHHPSSRLKRKAEPGNGGGRGVRSDSAGRGAFILKRTSFQREQWGLTQRTEAQSQDLDTQLEALH